ncbi:MAG: hypothetical protein ACYCPO_06005 [Acidobacteriaceae bacterium]
MNLESLCHLSTSGFVSLAVSLASLLLSVAALYVAWSSLSQAKQVADRAQRDAWSSLSQAKQVAERAHTEWRQRTWYDLYFKADEAYDALDHFLTQYPNAPLPGKVTDERSRQWNDLICTMRTVQRIATVFPINSVTDKLVSATCIPDKTTQTISDEQRRKLFDAVDGVRGKALVDRSVLE